MSEKPSDILFSTLLNKNILQQQEKLQVLFWRQHNKQRHAWALYSHAYVFYLHAPIDLKSMHSTISVEFEQKCLQEAGKHLQAVFVKA